MDTRLEEHRESLWMLVVSPTIWAVHFGLCYITAAIWCAKVPSALAPLGGVRTAVVVFTILALGGIAFMGWMGYRAHSYGEGSPPHDDDTPEDRHRFMGYATLLLSGLSGVAVTFAALVVLFVETCQ
jgi:threonine/homoserine/homoserine lactone efflux protein